MKESKSATEKALDRYYENPKICLFCNEIIKVKEGSTPSEARKKKFCSSSCSAKYNNKGKKRHGESHFCKKCGKKSPYKIEMCQDCYNFSHLERHFKKTLQEIMQKGNARVKWSSLREKAKRVLVLFKREEKCHICNHDIVLDVAHIKPISEFPLDTLCEEVNNPNNLVYLCPTHHRMLDKGLIKLE